MNLLTNVKYTEGVITIFPSERIWFWTGTNQAIFSSRRARLIQRVVKVPFFRFGGSPDWWGWRSHGEWSGHCPVFAEAGPSGVDHLGGGFLPLLARLPVRAQYYADIETVFMVICYGHLMWRCGFPNPIPCEHKTRRGLDGVRRVRRDPDRCLRMQQSLR